MRCYLHLWWYFLKPGWCRKRNMCWREMSKTWHELAGDERRHRQKGGKRRFCKTAQINYFSLICSIIEPQWEISSWRHPYSVFRMAITSYGRWSHASEGSISMSNNGQLSGSNTKSKRLLGHECKGRFILNCILGRYDLDYFGISIRATSFFLPLLVIFLPTRWVWRGV